MAKDAGFKVVAHMMPDLPNVGWERDVEQFIVSDTVKGDNSTKYMYVCELIFHFIDAGTLPLNLNLKS